MRYRDFPKGDARRYFVVLLAIDHMKRGEATMHRVSTAVECTRAEAQRAVHALVEQFGVTVDRDGAAYLISAWGALKKAEVEKLAKSLCTNQASAGASHAAGSYGDVKAHRPSNSTP
ncbi:hypothetical protein [Duganella sp. LjRoot269]|uniref:hypothetical protein n=1 Tax=Duganella sp. LjRoot269 TaxID=3342305 RepID=UPI003ED11DE0